MTQQGPEPPDNFDILRAFEREPDGRWRCMSPVSIVTPEGTVSVEPGAVFAYGDRLGPLDVAEYLEELGAQFGS